MKAVAALVLTIVRLAPCTCLVHTSLSVNMGWTDGWLDRWIELVAFLSFSWTPAKRLFLAGVGGHNDLLLCLSWASWEPWGLAQRLTYSRWPVQGDKAERLPLRLVAVVRDLGELLSHVEGKDSTVIHGSAGNCIPASHHATVCYSGCQLLYWLICT